MNYVGKIVGFGYERHDYSYTGKILEISRDPLDQHTIFKITSLDNKLIYGYFTRPQFCVLSKKKYFLEN